MNSSSTCTLPALARGALLAAMLALGAAPSVYAGPSHGHASACQNCGTVIAARTYQQAAAQGNGIGVATGAVVGGLLGNQIGNGNGRTLATVAGAIGGGYAGNEVEKRSRSSTVTTVRVRMSDGSVRSFTEAGSNARRVGARVKVVNGALRAQS